MVKICSALLGFVKGIHRTLAKNNHRLLISPSSSTTVFSDLTLWRHHCLSVTSCEREAWVLWRHIRRLFLHAQIGTKLILTNKQQPWISISYHPVFAAEPVRKTSSDKKSKCAKTLKGSSWFWGIHSIALLSWLFYVISSLTVYKSNKINSYD